MRKLIPAGVAEEPRKLTLKKPFATREDRIAGSAHTKI